MRICHSLHKKIKFTIKDFFSKCDQIRRKLRIWSHLLKKPSLENFIFCAILIWYIIKKDLLLMYGNIYYPLNVEVLRSKSER